MKRFMMEIKLLTDFFSKEVNKICIDCYQSHIDQISSESSRSECYEKNKRIEVSISKTYSVTNIKSYNGSDFVSTIDYTRLYCELKEHQGIVM